MFRCVNEDNNTINELMKLQSLLSGLNQSMMGYNEVTRKPVYQHYPQNMIHTFDTEHLCQAQCHVPCSMKHISDLMMQRWLCPVKVYFFYLFPSFFFLL